MSQLKARGQAFIPFHQLVIECRLPWEANNSGGVRPSADGNSQSLAATCQQPTGLGTGEERLVLGNMARLHSPSLITGITCCEWPVHPVWGSLLVTQVGFFSGNLQEEGGRNEVCSLPLLLDRHIRQPLSPSCTAWISLTLG